MMVVPPYMCICQHKLGGGGGADGGHGSGSGAFDGGVSTIKRKL